MKTRGPRLLLLALLAGAASLALLGDAGSRLQAQGCGVGINPVVCENQKPGSPSSQWDVSGGGDPSIAGFATEISVNHGSTVRFKVQTDAPSYGIDVYRLGYYGGAGARLVASLTPAVPLPQFQPPCLTDSATGLVDCGNWQESAAWQVPPEATSGIYIAKLTRLDTGGSNHIYFVVRADDAKSDLLFQTSDTTWQAYNTYGGNSLYQGAPVGRAYKVSYNRPFANRTSAPRATPFHAEYPMVRWLEANGFDVSYFTGADTDRLGSELVEHKAFLSVGHDEYWSGPQRANVEAARAAGVHLVFLSGNDIFWKTRWEPSMDGAGTPYRTLVSYKETHANQKIDPDPTWTGTWRDPRFSPPSDGGRPENGLTGTIFAVETGTSAIQVGESFSRLRLWRNTSVATLAPGAFETLAPETLGYEWNEDVDNGHRPPGLIQLSSTTANVDSRLLDAGSTYGSGTATHSLTMYRHASGALVFSAGTIQWSWGLDPEHDLPTTATSGDVRMEQFTVNLLADMGVQGATLRPGLVQATATTDVVPPSTTITSPVNGSDVASGGVIQITGTAVDGEGAVAAVEVSVDGGSTWRPATGREAWSYAWSPTSTGAVTIRARAVDDSGNIETVAAQSSVTVISPQCPCTIWNPGVDLPAVIDTGDSSGVELGVKFRAGMSGFITGLRFYKSAANTGVHVGSLWTAAGTLLGTATFTSETAAGWQQVSFTTPIAITANTVYVASYHTNAGHYSATGAYFASAGVDTPPLHALANLSTDNGVYRYGPGGFPSSSYNASNYWVDVVFDTSIGGNDSTPPSVVTVTPAAGTVGVATAARPSVTFSEPVDPATVTTTTIELRDGTALVPTSVTYDAPTRTATLTPAAALTYGTTYTTLVRGGTTDPRVKDLAGNALAANVTASFTTVTLSACPCSLWQPGTAVPAVVDVDDRDAVELGVKFRADTDGFITGLRFYKSAANTGTHLGNLWTGGGTLLATATFAAESASGWQEVSFSTPVAVVANTIYVASYHTNTGHYSATGGYFTAGVDAPPLHALANVSNANGVYRYGASGFPSNSWNAANYWVDVIFNTTTGGADTTPPTVVMTSPQTGATGVATTANLSATFSETVDPATVTTNTVELRAGGILVPASVTYDAPTRTATLTPAAALAYGTSYVARVRGGATDPRVKDLAGNALAADFTASFTTVALTACPCSLWQPGIGGPATVAVNDPNAVELGVKFRADTDGYITALRFYKSAANTGVHAGNLWTSSGTLLATATFTAESASGWQEVSFATPVAVVANATYVASYHTTTGYYSATAGYFAAAGVDAPPLHALANFSSANGVYSYGPSGFPSFNWNATNYWVDVVFNHTGGPVEPPTRVIQTTIQDFAAGELDADGYLSVIGDGELMLAPALGAEFSGTALPSGWVTTPWGGSSSTVVGNGKLTADGARVSPQALFESGRSLEFAATFSGAPYQHFGLGVTLTDGLWALFSSGPGDALYVRTNNGSVSTNTAIPGNWFGARHQFRIDWTPVGFAYWIDGAQVAVHAHAISSSLRPIASDYDPDGSVLAVDWVHVTPYAASTTFTSAIVDAAVPVKWSTASLSASVPVGTAVALSVRYGDTKAPDASWTAFVPVTDETLNAQSRYIQYRLVLSSTDPNKTPTVSDVTLNFSR